MKPQASISSVDSSMSEKRLSGSKLVALYQLEKEKRPLVSQETFDRGSGLVPPPPTVVAPSSPTSSSSASGPDLTTASLLVAARRKPAAAPWFVADANRSFDLSTRKRPSTTSAPKSPTLGSSASCEDFYSRVGSIVSASRNSKSVGSRLLRTPTQTTRGESIDSTKSTDITNIGVGWMRVNGALSSFRSLLSKDSRQESPEVTHQLRRQFTVGSTGPPQVSFDDSVSKKSFSVFSGGGQGPVPPQSRIKTAVSNRLIRRQELYDRRKHNSDYALFFALLGIIMMILENELTAARIYSKGSIYSYVMCSFILLSTIILLGLIVQFHLLEIKLFMNDNSAEDWRIAMTSRRIIQITVELCICAICPVPGDFTFDWTTVHADGETVTHAKVPLDVLLSIPMFLRMYLICRVMLLHSRLFTDASSRSIGALNRVNFNARFVLKTLMTLCPGTVLLVFTASLWVIGAWIMRLCERYHTEDDSLPQAIKHQNYLNSLWLIAITFLSVGYGDIVPNTYCGRAVAVITGIMGAFTSSMVVAVLARKLELTRAEKHVHNFMMDTQLTKRMKHAAANVLRETWLIYKNRALVDKIDSSKIRLHQRKFLMAIYDLRKVKRDQRKLAENSHTIGDIAKTSANTHEMISDMMTWQEGIAMRMTALENRLEMIHGDMRHLVRLVSGRSPRQLSIEEEPLGEFPERPRRRAPMFTQNSTTNA